MATDDVPFWDSVASVAGAWRDKSGVKRGLAEICMRLVLSDGEFKPLWPILWEQVIDRGSVSGREWESGDDKLEIDSLEVWRF